MQIDIVTISVLFCGIAFGYCVATLFKIIKTRREEYLSARSEFNRQLARVSATMYEVEKRMGDEFMPEVEDVVWYIIIRHIVCSCSVDIVADCGKH